MKAEAWIFAIATIFMVLVTPAYWFITGAGETGADWTGTSALTMTALLTLMVTIYLGFHARKMEPRPEDRQDAEIADGAGRLRARGGAMRAAARGGSPCCARRRSRGQGEIQAISVTRLTEHVRGSDERTWAPSRAHWVRSQHARFAKACLHLRLARPLSACRRPRPRPPQRGAQHDARPQGPYRRHRPPP